LVSLIFLIPSLGDMTTFITFAATRIS